MSGKLDGIDLTAPSQFNPFIDLRGNGKVKIINTTNHHLDVRLVFSEGELSSVMIREADDPIDQPQIREASE